MNASDRSKATARQAGARPGTFLPPDDRSPPDLDAAILEAARRAVRFHWLTVSLERLRPAPGSAWQLLLALVVGLLAGLGLETLVSKPREPALTPTVHAGDSLVVGAKPRGESDAPERWLKSIAALLQQGRVAEAEAELAAFHRRYPQ